MNLKFAFKGFLMPASILAMLSLASCSNDVVLDEDFAEQENTLTFSMRTPAGDKVSYSRADGVLLHDAPEYKINTIVLYEYEVMDNGEGKQTTSLTRELSFPTGTGKNVIDLKDGGDGSYSFSIVIPADYKNRKFTYRLVANNIPSKRTIGETIGMSFDGRKAVLNLDTIQVPKNENSTDSIKVAPTGDLLANPEIGIAMTGRAKVKETGSETIVIGETTTC